ncbi:dual specificity protein phosphatase [Baffinella frigidus]|nr:dual specificity protein phosphatase [Cryptophyta sp. CCMP2293]
MCRLTRPVSQVDATLLYYPFCADFGPLSFNCVYKFCKMLKGKLEDAEKDGIKVVLYTSSDPRLRTNAATLLACYLVLECAMTPEEACAPLNFDGRSPFLSYRDATFDPQNFDLQILDVVRGIHKACECGAVDYKMFNLEEYEYYDHPAVPHPEPQTLNPESCGESSSFATLTPADYIQIFAKLNVTAVCRLNEKHYDKQDFLAAGIGHYDMYFEDCSSPTALVIEQFFEMCERETGTIAVHCKVFTNSGFGFRGFRGLGLGFRVSGLHSGLHRGCTGFGDWGWGSPLAPSLCSARSTPYNPKP